MTQTTINIFISAVSDEYRSLRKALLDFIGRPGVRIEEQAGFVRNGLPILTELNGYVKNCDAVIHLVGERTGNANDDGIPGDENRRALLKLVPDLPARFQLSDSELGQLSYTQWEAILALYHGCRMYVATPGSDVKPDTQLTDSSIRDRQAQSQREHLARLQRLEKWPEFSFESAHHLCLQVYRVLYDILPRPDVLLSPRLPPSLGRLFKGRDGWMARIREEVRAPGNSDASRVVLHGMGGLGKTQLVAEYAYACAHEHNALLIVTAESVASWELSMADLCGVLKLPQAASNNPKTRIKAALEWLGKQENRGWLLIVDNVDDPGMFATVVDQVRSLHRGTILLTSRLSRWPQGFVDLELDLLEEAAAVDYLLEATAGKRNSLDPERGAGADRTLAATVADNLGRLTLGIVQAAGTINTLRWSFDDYLQQWNESRESLIDDEDFDPQRSGYPRSVASAWLTTYRQLPPESALVFDALCWLAPDPIPERMVTQPWSEAMRELVPESIRVAVNKRYRRSLIPLYDFSLASSPQGSQRLFSVHKLVQEVGRIWQRKAAEKPLARSLAYQMLANDFVRPDTIENIRLNILPQLRVLIPHAYSILAEPGFADAESGLASRLHCMLAELGITEGSLLLAQQAADRAVDLARKALDASSSTSKVTLMNAICIQAQVFNARGQFDQSLAAGEEQIQLAEELCGREPDNLAHQRELGIALDNVGRVLENKGDQEGALKLFVQSQQIRDELCRREPDNLAHQRDLGIALFYLGRLNASLKRPAQAKSYLTRAVKILAELIANGVGFGSLESDLKVVQSVVAAVDAAMPVMNLHGRLSTDVAQSLRLARKTKSLWAKQVNEPTEVQTMEGCVTAEPGDYLCRGIQEEQWPQKAIKLLEKYVARDEIDTGGWQRFDPKPEAAPVEAAPIANPFRVIAQWGELCGKANDYLVRSTTDPSDIWIVDKAIFQASYEFDSQ